MATKSKTTKKTAPAIPDEITSIELKAYKEAGRSETTRFELKLYFNGAKKPACIVSNDGGGGIHDYYWYDGCEKMEKKFIAYIQKQIQEGMFDEYYEYYVNRYYSSNPENARSKEEFLLPDDYVNHLIDQHKCKQDCNKFTCFTLKSDEYGDYNVLKQPYCERVKQYLTKHFGDNLKEILNERFIEQLSKDA